MVTVSHAVFATVSAAPSSSHLWLCWFPQIFWGADGGKQAALLGVFSSKIIGYRGDMEGLEYREENCSPELSEI